MVRFSKIRGLLIILLLLVAVNGYAQNYLVTTNANGPGSLVEAVGSANSDGVPSTITFDLPQIPSGFILLDGSLILTEDGTTIDGDFDGDGDPDITLYTTNPADLLEIQSSGHTIQYLNLATGINQSVNNAGIKIDGSGANNNTVIGCYLNTELTGTTPLATTFYNGIMIINGATGNRIGGTTSSEKSTIVSSQAAGINITGSSGNSIGANNIGANVTFSANFPNGTNGVEIISSSNTSVGNTFELNYVGSGSQIAVLIDNSAQTSILNTKIDGAPFSTGIRFRNDCSQSKVGDGTDSGRNYIVTLGAGIFIEATSGGVEINNNWFNRDENGLPAGLLSRLHHIHLEGSGNSILNNLIAFDQENGVFIASGSQNNLISLNSIWRNGLSGIEIGDAAQGNISPPSIISITTSGFQGTADPNAIIELFADRDDEGELYLATTTADASGG